MRAGAAWLLVANVAVQAATFTANLATDLPDLLPGNGSCSVLPQAGPGPCTLRAAVIEANALAGLDRINLVAGMSYVLTRVGVNEANAWTGDLDINDSLQILYLGSDAMRPIIDVNGLERAFTIRVGNVTLLGFDITGGNATVANARTGGALNVVSTAGAVLLQFLRLYGNRANTGGVLLNNGSATTISGSELHANEWVAFFGGLDVGSAIQNYGQLIVEASAIHSNTSSDGSSAATIATRGNDAETILINTTVASNAGTGIEVAIGARLELRNSTVGGNAGFGIRFDPSGGVLRMRNSAIARNLLDCEIGAGGTVDVDAYNLDSDASCGLAGGTGNLSGISNPGLTPLARRGGPTPAIWPLRTTAPGVIDRGHPVVAATGCESSDQQFAARPLDGNGDGLARCDIGAVESDEDRLFFDPFERL